jgi:hypothetical protein
MDVAVKNAKLFITFLKKTERNYAFNMLINTLIVRFSKAGCDQN